MLGIDRFILSTSLPKNLRLGILTNHATLDGSGLPVALSLLRQGIPLKKLFSPEHGVYSQAEDGAAQQNQIDSLTKLPVVSLYGDKLVPSEEDLNDIDVVLVDLPNIGCRFYTYWWTLTHLLEACGRYQNEVIVLDRPNMRGANSVTEGPILDEATCSTFLGRWSMPLAFSYTLGELARWFNHQRSLNVSLQVIPSTLAEALHFVPPSPAINEKQTALIYPCTGIFEGVNVSVGRGTTFPFRVIGAPWIDALNFLEFFTSLKLAGVQAYPYSFKPMWSVYENQYCSGLYFIVTDVSTFQPVNCALQLLRYLINEYPQLTQALYPTAANPSGGNHLDRLLGVQNSYQHIKTEFENFKLLTNNHKVNHWQKSVIDFLKK